MTWELFHAIFVTTISAWLQDSIVSESGKTEGEMGIRKIPSDLFLSNDSSIGNKKSYKKSFVYTAVCSDVLGQRSPVAHSWAARCTLILATSPQWDAV